LILLFIGLFLIQSAVEAGASTYTFVTLSGTSLPFGTL